jgi:Ca2+-binding RTX toxin-like protein
MDARLADSVEAGGTTVRKFTRAAAVFAALAVLALSQVATAQSQTIPVVDLNLQAPGITVGDVNVIGPSEATALLTVDTNGLATNVFVEYGANGVLDQRTPVISLAAGLDLANVLVQLLGLDPGSIISYRIVAENSSGTTTTPTATISTPPSGGSGGPGGSGSATFTFVDLASGQMVSGAAASGKRTARCTIVGTARSDRLRGTSKKDVICGLGGNDRIQARGGNDVVVGGPGRDTLNGNKGRDRLYGNGGNDKLVSRDRKIGEPLDGGTGRDRATADRGDRMMSFVRGVRGDVMGG